MAAGGLQGGGSPLEQVPVRGKAWARQSASNLARRLRKERALQTDKSLVDEAVQSAMASIDPPPEAAAELGGRLEALGRALLLHQRLDRILGSHRHRLGDALRDVVNIVQMPDG